MIIGCGCDIIKGSDDVIGANDVIMVPKWCPVIHEPKGVVKDYSCSRFEVLISNLLEMARGQICYIVFIMGFLLFMQWTPFLRFSKLAVGLIMLIMLSYIHVSHCKRFFDDSTPICEVTLVDKSPYWALGRWRHHYFKRVFLETGRLYWNTVKDNFTQRFKIYILQ